MKNVNESLFHAICFCFSALLLVMSLLGSIRLAAANDRNVRLERQIRALQEENAVLRQRYESSISLEEVERYATEVLGMQRCTPAQIIYLPLD